MRGAGPCSQAHQAPSTTISSQVLLKQCSRAQVGLLNACCGSCTCCSRGTLQAFQGGLCRSRRDIAQKRLPLKGLHRRLLFLQDVVQQRLWQGPPADVAATYGAAEQQVLEENTDTVPADLEERKGSNDTASTSAGATEQSGRPSTRGTRAYGNGGISEQGPEGSRKQPSSGDKACSGHKGVSRRRTPGGVRSIELNRKYVKDSEISAEGLLEAARRLAGVPVQNGGAQLKQELTALAAPGPEKKAEQLEARRRREREWLALIQNAGRLSVSAAEKSNLVQQLLELMCSSKGQYLAIVSAHHVRAAVTVCARDGNLESAEKVVSFGRRIGGFATPNAFVYSALATGYCEEGQWEKGYQVLSVMEQEDIRPDVVLFNVLLEGAESEAAGRDLWQRMQGCGVLPNERSFSAMMRCLGRGGNVSAALELWEGMKSAGIKATVFTYNSLLDVYARAGQLGQCWGMLRQMADAQVAPDSATWHTLINAHALQKDIEGAVDALQAMQQAGFAPGIVAYNILLEACLRSRQLERVFTLYRTALKAALRPDHTTFAALLRAAGHLREREAVEWVLAEMDTHNCEHDAVTYRCAVFAFVRCGEGGSALEMLTRMMSAGMEPAMDPTTVLVKSVDAALLREVTAAGPAGRLKPFLLDMSRAGLSPTPATAANIVKRLTASHGPFAALEVAGELQAAGVRPLGDSTWDAILMSLRNTSKQEAPMAKIGQKVFAAMEADGCTVTGEAYEALITACARNGDGASALSLYEAMQAKGIPADFSLDSIFLATVDAAITDAIATGETEDSPKRGTSESQDTRLVEDLAAAGIRLKPRAVSKVIQRLTAGPKEPVLRGRPPPLVTAEGWGGRGAEEGLQRALVLMDVLPRLFDVQPTSATYASLMHACIRQGEALRIEELWLRMKSEGVAPDAATWQARIRGMAQRNLVTGQTRALLSAIANDGITPTQPLLRTLVRCCRQARDWEGAEYVHRLAEAMERQSERSKEPLAEAVEKGDLQTSTSTIVDRGQDKSSGEIRDADNTGQDSDSGTFVPEVRHSISSSRSKNAWLGGGAFEWSAQDWQTALVRHAVGPTQGAGSLRSRLSLLGWKVNANMTRV